MLFKKLKQQIKEQNEVIKLLNDRIKNLEEHVFSTSFNNAKEPQRSWYLHLYRKHKLYDKVEMLFNFLGVEVKSVPEKTILVKTEKRLKKEKKAKSGNNQ